MHFDCDIADTSVAALRAIAAAGTLVNFITGTLSLALLKSVPAATRPRAHFFFWLFAAINLLMGAGYFLFSGLGNIGDWAVVANGLPPAAWRPAFAVFGFAAYFLLARVLAQALRSFVGNDEQSVRRARLLAMTAYFTGGLLYCVSGLFNPLGPVLIAISAAAASFGGASGLLWLSELLRHFPTDAMPAIIGRSHGWIGVGLAAAIVFVAIFGPGVHFQGG